MAKDTGDITTDASTPSVLVKLNRAHWVGEERHNPPEEIIVSLDDALRMIELGVASRTDKLRAE